MPADMRSGLNLRPGRHALGAPSPRSMNESAPLFDPALVRRRIARAWRSGYAGFLLERVAEDLEDRLAAVTRSFPLGLDLGTPLPLVSERLLQTGRVERMIRL